MNPLKIAVLMTAIIEELSKRGMKVEFQRDIADLYDLHGRMEGNELSPLFSPDKFDLNADNSFWIAGVGEDNVLCHVQALKLDETGRRPLGDILKKQLSRVFDCDEPSWKCRALEEIKGKVAYQGDLWVSPRHGHITSGSLLVRLGILAAASKWNPDYIYAFFEHRSANKGLSFKGWYPKYERIGQHWHNWLHETEWISWLSAADLESLIELETKETATSLR